MGVGSEVVGVGSVSRPSSLGLGSAVAEPSAVADAEAALEGEPATEGAGLGVLCSEHPASISAPTNAARRLRQAGTGMRTGCATLTAPSP